MITEFKKYELIANYETVEELDYAFIKPGSSRLGYAQIINIDKHYCLVKFLNTLKVYSIPYKDIMYHAKTLTELEILIQAEKYNL